MDLAGPKIRTGYLGTSIRPLKIAVPKDVYGLPLKLAEGFLDSEARFTEKINLTGVPPSFVISIKNGFTQLSNLKIGEKLWLRDTRERYRTVTVLEKISATKVKIGLDKTTYLEEDIVIHRKKRAEISNNPTKVKGDGISDTAGPTNSHSLSPTEYEMHPKDWVGHNDDISITTGPIKPQPTTIEVKAGDTVLLQRKESPIQTYSSASQVLV